MELTPELLIPLYGILMYFSYGYRLTYFAKISANLFVLSSIIFWAGSIFGSFLASKFPKIFRIFFFFPALGYIIFPLLPFFGTLLFGIAVGVFWTILTAHFMLGSGHGKRSGMMTLVSTFVSFFISISWGKLMSAYPHEKVAPFFALISFFFLPFSIFSRFSYAKGFRLHRAFAFQFLTAFPSVMWPIQGLILLKMGLKTPSELSFFLSISLLISALLSYLLGHLTDTFGGRKEAIKAFSVILPVLYLYLISNSSIYGFLVASAFITSIGTVTNTLALALQADYKLKGIEDMAFRQFCYALAAIFAYLLSFNLKVFSYTGVFLSLFTLAL